MTEQVDTWWVFVEENTGNTIEPNWRYTHWTDAGADRETAVELAKRTALEHRPKNPWVDLGRQVFEVGQDSWIVVVQGQRSTHIFRTHIGRLVATAGPLEPGGGDVP